MNLFQKLAIAALVLGVSVLGPIYRGILIDQHLSGKLQLVDINQRFLMLKGYTLTASFAIAFGRPVFDRIWHLFLFVRYLFTGKL